MVRSKIIVAAAFVAAIPHQAMADWQFTKWGMTPEEVSAASDGMAPISNGRPGMRISSMSVGNVGSYETSDYKFEAVFYYKENSLQRVDLNLLNIGKCKDLRIDLIGKYGKQFGRESFTSNVWLDKENGNRVSLLDLGTFCTLSYKPIVSSGNDGI